MAGLRAPLRRSVRAAASHRAGQGTLQGQLVALERTRAYKALAKTPEFAALKAQWGEARGDSLPHAIASRLDLVAAVYKTHAFEVLRKTSEAKAVEASVARCDAGECTRADQALLEGNVTAALFSLDSMIKAVEDLGRPEDDLFP